MVSGHNYGGFSLFFDIFYNDGGLCKAVRNFSSRSKRSVFMGVARHPGREDYENKNMYLFIFLFLLLPFILVQHLQQRQYGKNDNNRERKEERERKYSDNIRLSKNNNTNRRE